MQPPIWLRKQTKRWKTWSPALSNPDSQSIRRIPVLLLLVQLSCHCCMSINHPIPALHCSLQLPRRRNLHIRPPHPSPNLHSRPNRRNHQFRACSPLHLHLPSLRPQAQTPRRHRLQPLHPTSLPCHPRQRCLPHSSQHSHVAPTQAWKFNREFRSGDKRVYKDKTAIEDASTTVDGVEAGTSGDGMGQRKEWKQLGDEDQNFCESSRGRIDGWGDGALVEEFGKRGAELVRTFQS